MEELYTSTLIIISLAVLATVLAYLLKISIALVEIFIGIVGGFVLQLWFPSYLLNMNSA